MAEPTTDAHGATEAAHGAAEAAHGAESAGLPQLDFSSFPNQIFWLVVALVAIYLILSKIALPRIASVLADRQGKITGDIAMAEELKLKAEEAEKAYDKALADARAEAHEIVAQAKAEMQAELDAASEKADAEIAAKLVESEGRIAEIRDGALEAVKTVAADAAAEIVATLGGNPDGAAIQSAVDARVKG